MHNTMKKKKKNIKHDKIKAEKNIDIDYEHSRKEKLKFDDKKYFIQEKLLHILELTLDKVPLNGL